MFIIGLGKVTKHNYQIIILDTVQKCSQLLYLKSTLSEIKCNYLRIFEICIKLTTPTTTKPQTVTSQLAPPNPILLPAHHPTMQC